MERAAQLLQGNHMTVTGVACAVGFVNRGSFAAAFKRKFGVNPVIIDLIGNLMLMPPLPISSFFP
ncbi:MAG: helix-turn-helix domain-containing protein [Pseudanabaenales cyanobacterium]|nr:helix-turn-helix domain-containing protein [Pseudanabaenales cyanobacterium]